VKVINENSDKKVIKGLFTKISDGKHEIKIDVFFDNLHGLEYAEWRHKTWVRYLIDHEDDFYEIIQWAKP